MPSEIILLIFSVLVVISVALFRKYVLAAANLGALFVTIIACVIFAAIHVYIVGGTALSFPFAFAIIYAVSNLIFQLITKVSGRSL